MAQELPKALNLLDPAEKPTSAWDKIYLWVFSIGRYVIIGVELVVLLAFAGRFVLDRRNNDLKESIDVKVRILQEQKEIESELRRIQAILNNFSDIIECQEIISPKLTDILDDIPDEFELDSISISQASVNFSGIAPSYEVIKTLEDDLKEDPDYGDVSVEISKGDVESDVEGSFRVQFTQDEDGGC